jgi:hypothetical protein
MPFAMALRVTLEGKRSYGLALAADALIRSISRIWLKTAFRIDTFTSFSGIFSGTTRCIWGDERRAQRYVCIRLTVLAIDSNISLHSHHWQS